MSCFFNLESKKKNMILILRKIHHQFQLVKFVDKNLNHIKCKFNQKQNINLRTFFFSLRYLTHYRRHLENSREDNKSDILDSDINCDRSSDIRNYSCNICSKRFSR